MIDDEESSANDIHISLPARVALASRSGIGEQPDPLAADDVTTYKLDARSYENSTLLRRQNLSEFLADQAAFFNDELSPKISMDSNNDRRSTQAINEPFKQTESSSMVSMPGEGTQIKAATAARVRSFVAVGRSKRSSASKSVPKTKRDTPKGPKALDEQGVFEEGLTDLDKALRSAREEIGKMQHELEKYRQQEKPSLEEFQGLGEPLLSRVLSESPTSLTEDRFHMEKTMIQLRSDLQAERTEKTLWQGKHDEIKEKYLKAESEARILRANMFDRDHLWKKEWERKHEHLLAERDRFQDGYHAAQKTLREREDEIQQLRHHILGLKRDISTWTKVEGQVSDDVFTERIRTLGHDLQNWTIINFRRAKKDISNLSDSVRLEVEGFLPDFSRMLCTTSTPNVIQSIVACILVADIFHIYYFGLDEEHTDYLQRMEDHMTAIAPPVKVNEWRSTTLSIIKQSPTPEFQTRAMGLSRRTHDRINRIVDELTGTGTNGTRDKGLQSVLDQSIDLSQTFRVQRAQLTVHLPATVPDSRLAFDSEIMEDITGEDDEVLEGEDVKCVMFPYVLKLGDETGDNPHLRNVLVKAKVCCG